MADSQYGNYNAAGGGSYGNYPGYSQPAPAAGAGGVAAASYPPPQQTYDQNSYNTQSQGSWNQPSYGGGYGTTGDQSSYNQPATGGSYPSYDQSTNNYGSTQPPSQGYGQQSYQAPTGGYDQSGGGGGGTGGSGQYSSYGQQSSGYGQQSGGYGGQQSYGGNQSYGGPPPSGGGYGNGGGPRGGGGGYNSGGRGGYNKGYGGGDRGDMIIQEDTVFVSGMNPGTSEEEIQQHFGSIGIIKTDRRTGKPKIWMYKDKISGKPKGEATVTYDDSNAAKSAIDWFDGKDFKGSMIKVQIAQHKNNYAARGGRGGGRGGGMDRGGRGGGSRDGDRGSGGGFGRDGDWRCPNSDCGNTNFSWRTECNRCNQARPEGMGGGEPPSRGGGRGGRGGMDRGGFRGRGGDRGGRGEYRGRGDRGGMDRGRGGRGGPMRGGGDRGRDRSKPY